MRLTTIIFAAALTISTTTAVAEEARREIIVTGEGRVSAEPDMATISLGVSREARTAAQAMDDASAAIAQVLDDVGKSGIKPKDVQTSSVSLSPRWDHSKNNAPPRVTGYVASNTLSIRVRELEKLGSLLDSVVGSGANTMHGLNFSIANPRPLEDEARTAAVKDALSKASLLAEAANVALGRVQTISEGAISPPNMPFAQGRAMMEASSVPIATGEVDIQIRVTVVFLIGG